MPELAKPDLEQLITELLVALRPKCCRLVQCPDLSADPSFRLKIPALGQLIYIVPDTISTEEAAKQIERGQILATKNNFHIVSDGRQGQVLHLSLSNCPSIGWRQSIRSALNRLLADQWEMIFVEKSSDNGQTQIGLLRASEEGEEESGGEGDEGPREVWMAPVNRRIVAGCVKKVKKKIIRKVVRKASRGEEEAGHQNWTICNGKVNGEEAKTMESGKQKKGGELPASMPLQNGHGGGRTPPASPKQQNGRGEGLVGRIANIFNGMSGGGGNGRTGRGRSQSLEETTENGEKIGAGEKMLKRSDSEGASSESTTATMTEKTIQNGKERGGNGGDLGAEKTQPLIQRQDSFSGPFFRIPVINGATPSPERENPNPKDEQQNSKGPPLANGNAGAMGNGQILEGKSTKIAENKTMANGPHSTASTKPLSLPVASNRPISSSPPKDSPPSPISPPTVSAGSDSPNSFHSASGESPLALAASSRRWRREDAPSPSTSLIQNAGNGASRRNGPNGAQGPGAPPISRLGPPLGSLLSPISSCGSVEGQNDLEDADDHGSEEEESTLMLLNRASAGRSILGGEDPDELSCSLRDDFSLASISQKGGPTVERIGGMGGTFSASAAAAIRQNHLQQAAGRTAQMMGNVTRRVQSPSPTKQAVSQSPAPPMVRGMVGTFRMPVPVLQQVIGLFSYKEMGELRRVHPHWDELCGQMLNAAHSHLLHQAQRLLTDCQRRVHREPRMAQPVQLLTRLHVHVLNPVDGMRAFMDEGVLCFPYGALLDGAYAMLGRIQSMIANSAIDTNEAREREYDDASIQMDQVGEMARRAALHYRQWVEPEAEKRMSELYRASAQQRLQRLDSFLVESNVSRVERESEKARSELGWEMEQLRQQNQQLRKENRELKQLCQRLDQRVDVLERKFKTMARLLQ